MRRQEVFDKINRRKKTKGSAAQGRQSDYRSVIKEVQFDEDWNIFGVITSFFKTGRKLKPLVKKRQATALESLSETKLMVHVIRGSDVPIRVDYFNEFAKNQREIG